MNSYSYAEIPTFSTTDMAGAARFTLCADDRATLAELQETRRVLPDDVYASAFSGDDVVLDLLVHNVTFALAEQHKLEQHLGDSFEMLYFGMQPTVLQLQGTLLDTPDNSAKRRLTSLYRNLFRIRKVARWGIAPYLVLPGASVCGCFLELGMTEVSESPEIVRVAAGFLVFSMEFSNPDNLNGSTATTFPFTSSEPLTTEDLPGGAAEPFSF